LTAGVRDDDDQDRAGCDPVREQRVVGRGTAVTAEPQQRPTSSSEAAEAVAAQIRDVRDVLRTDAAVAGIDVEHVDTAVDTALADYADARVHGFIGVLVEREVRAALRLRRRADSQPSEAAPTPPV
jgi:hypothetical protein